MAVKMQDRHMVGPEDGGDGRFVRLILPPPMHKRLRVLAAEADKPMAHLVRDIVAAYLDKKGK